MMDNGTLRINGVKLTPAMRRMLVRVWDHSGNILESQLVGSGGRASSNLNSLLLAGLVDIVEHPTVKEGATRVPAAAVAITDSGRKLSETLQAINNR